MKPDMMKFSIAQMTSNADGKTSSSGTCGCYIIVISVLAFVYGCVEFHSSGKADIMMYSSANILLGAGLLGYRKSVDKTSIQNGIDPSAKDTVIENNEQNPAADKK